MGSGTSRLKRIWVCLQKDPYIFAFRYGYSSHTDMGLFLFRYGSFLRAHTRANLIIYRYTAGRVLFVHCRDGFLCILGQQEHREYTNRTFYTEYYMQIKT